MSLVHRVCSHILSCAFPPTSTSHSRVFFLLMTHSHPHTLTPSHPHALTSSPHAPSHPHTHSHRHRHRHASRRVHRQCARSARAHAKGRLALAADGGAQFQLAVIHRGHEQSHAGNANERVHLPGERERERQRERERECEGRVKKPEQKSTETDRESPLFSYLYSTWLHKRHSHCMFSPPLCCLPHFFSHTHTRAQGMMGDRELNLGGTRGGGTANAGLFGGPRGVDVQVHPISTYTRTHTHTHTRAFNISGDFNSVFPRATCLCGTIMFLDQSLCVCIRRDCAHSSFYVFSSNVSSSFLTQHHPHHHYVFHPRARLRAHSVDGRRRARGDSARALHACAQQSLPPGRTDARRRYVRAPKKPRADFSHGHHISSVISFCQFARLHSSPVLAPPHLSSPRNRSFCAHTHTLCARRHPGQRARRARQHAAARGVPDQQQEDGETVSALGRRTERAERAGTGAAHMHTCTHTHRHTGARDEDEDLNMSSFQ